MNIKPGDELRVIIPGNRYRSGSPEGGHPAVVTKVGRKYGTVEYDNDGRARAIEFDLQTGRERGSASNYAARVETVAEAELGIRYATARKALFDAGVSILYDNRLTLEQFEAVAAIARTLPVLDRSRP